MRKTIMLAAALAVAGCGARQVPPPQTYRIDPVAASNERSAGDPSGFGMERHVPTYDSAGAVRRALGYPQPPPPEPPIYIYGPRGNDVVIPLQEPPKPQPSN